MCKCWSGGRRRGGRRSRSQLSFLLNVKLHLNHRGVILSTKHMRNERERKNLPHSSTRTNADDARRPHTIMSSKKAKTSSDDLTAFLAAAEAAAKGAGRMIREAHDSRAKGGAVKGIESKGSEETQTVDLVTATDKACEDFILSMLKEQFPDHDFIGEESSFTGPDGGPPEGALQLSDKPTWIVDPLDGTTNFVHGYPLVTVSIGLCVDKKPAVGVVYNPIMDELCSAATGKGCFLNGVRCHVGNATGVTSALVVNNIGASRNPKTNEITAKRILALLQANIRGLRNSGSAAQNMMHVACGRLDAYFEDGFGGPWDVCAGAVLLQEAGGICRDHLGGPFVLKAGKGQLLCGNAAVVEDIARVLKSVEE